MTTAPDFYNEIARERGAPEGWRWYSLQAVGENRKNGAAIVKGAVCTAVYKSGPRKGTTNWTKRDKSTEREFLITFAEYDARVAAYESSTGHCSSCGGAGKWESGRDCARCRGTGKAQQ